MGKIAAAALLTGVVALAHHSLAGTYRLEQQVTLQGTVSKFLLMNPHTWVEVIAPDQAGVPQTWSIEWNAAGVLGGRGVTRDTLKPGDAVTITMSPGKSQAEHRGLLRIIRRPSDGFEWGTKPGEVPVDWRFAQK